MSLMILFKKSNNTGTTTHDIDGLESNVDYKQDFLAC